MAVRRKQPALVMPPEPEVIWRDGIDVPKTVRNGLALLATAALELPALPRVRDPGLVGPPTRIAIEPAKATHKKVCAVCGMIPTARRLMVKEGSGRSQKCSVYCMDHGVDWLVRHAVNTVRGALYLRGRINCVRADL